MARNGLNAAGGQLSCASQLVRVRLRSRSGCRAAKIWAMPPPSGSPTPRPARGGRGKEPFPPRPPLARPAGPPGARRGEEGFERGRRQVAVPTAVGGGEPPPPPRVPRREDRGDPPAAVVA